MNKTLFFITIFSLSVIVSTQSFAAAPAPAALDLSAMMAAAQTAREKSQVLQVAAIKGQLDWVQRNMKEFFDQMHSENQADKLPILKADQIVAATCAEFVKVRGGNIILQPFQSSYHGIVRKRLR
ncbi:MAG TPA: hypothetical protein VGT41_02795 [Candidatus Babeliales bacterium]|nr:hypothetical protein [Candidatus Babeliales bacterium]